MKKILIGAGLLSLVMMSCTKDYTCECTYVSTFGGISTTTTDTYEVNDAEAHEAQAACNEATVVSESGLTKTTCVLTSK